MSHTPTDRSLPERLDPAGRKRRGRLLFVGRNDLGARVAPSLLEPPARAANVFEAIGELATSDVARPVVAVFVDDAVVPRDQPSVASALRHLDPSVRLVRVVARAGNAAEDAPATAGFDDVVVGPLDPAAMVHLLGAEWFAEDPTDAAETETETAPRPVAPAIEPAEHGVPEIEVVPAPSLPAPPTAASDAPGGPATASEPRDDLGDTDLLEAVMHDPHGVLDTALALVRQHTGWTDLAMVPPAQAEGARRARVDVRVGDDERGALVTTMAARAELAPWGAWLARWLTLDQTYRAYRTMAYRDDLTGSWNRRYFTRFLEETMAEASRRRRPVTVMVFDIDDFKRYNDAFGHEAGDVILQETVAVLNSIIRTSDRVCRIGGDEFAVIFADLEGPREMGSSHPESVEKIARRFQEQVCRMRFPKLGLEAPGNLSVSAGLATYPWDGNDPVDLLRLADERALQSKRKGKNWITLGPHAASQAGDGDACGNTPPADGSDPGSGP